MYLEAKQYDGTDQSVREIGEWSNRSTIHNTLNAPHVLFWAGYTLSPGDWALYMADGGYRAISDDEYQEIVR